jgi:UDP-2,3-diacylglucosamine pyrophosphatase LpxH
MHKTETAFLDDRKLFIISDLHIGDGSLRDNLIKDNKFLLFSRFLDEVEKQNGRLLILGDLLELWRYPWHAILSRWHRLFDRLAAMDVVYVPGNHDELHQPNFAACRSSHPFFNVLHRPFLKTVGGKRFMFMHGHEADPLISRHSTAFAPVLRFLAGTLELREDACLITSDRVTDFLLETGEQLLRVWQTLTRQVNHAMYTHLELPDSLTHLRYPLRTKNMLARFYDRQREGLYDITITGHTHHAGHYGGWYYNCGCWTRPIVNYLVVSPDGRIEICDWTPEGSSVNRESVA